MKIKRFNIPILSYISPEVMISSKYVFSPTTSIFCTCFNFLMTFPNSKLSGIGDGTSPYHKLELNLNAEEISPMNLTLKDVLLVYNFASSTKLLGISQLFFLFILIFMHYITILLIIIYVYNAVLVKFMLFLFIHNLFFWNYIGVVYLCPQYVWSNYSHLQKKINDYSILHITYYNIIYITRLFNTSCLLYNGSKLLFSI